MAARKGGAGAGESEGGEMSKEVEGDALAGVFVACNGLTVSGE